MNFYKEQDISQKRARILMLLFILSVIIVVFSTGMFFITLHTYMYSDENLRFTLSPFYILSHADTLAVILSFLGVFALILYGFLKKAEELSEGGKTIAKELHAIQLFGNTANTKEKILINIVEEMSIAASIPTIPIYVIESKHINAFVAGTTYDNAVFGVTRGAIELLERDELQGVIAHEFSHIFSGDMKINNRISSFVNGIMYIFIVGMEIILSQHPVDNPKGKLEEWHNMVLGVSFIFIYPAGYIIGACLAIIGFAGAACACFIQLFINYHREYLADAYAVQFTRYSDGIANALKKIGRYGHKLASANVGYFSHIFFASWSSPPAPNRIRKIEPSWDGKYIDVTKQKDKVFKKTNADAKQKSLQVMSVAYMLNQLSNVGNITKEQIERAYMMLENVPHSLKQSAENPLEAEFIIYALLFDKDYSIRQTQAEFAADKIFPNNAESQKAAINRINAIYADMILLERSLYLNIIHLCIAALKSITPAQYKTFKTIVNNLIEYDDHISLFEWCIKYLVIYPLDINFGVKKPPIFMHTHTGAVKEDIETLLSAVVYAKTKNDKEAKELFFQARNKAALTSLQYRAGGHFSSEAFEKAIDEIQNSKPFVRSKVMETVIYALTSDKKINTDDLIIIHAISEALHLPLGID
ncbi:MAG: M48 family metalloprotease [Campylobacteraceae bacterium]|jgi:Zn-dependent protease with chaperone function|nr:M48 family metalloprotease [Campylobacteraceae bacterium]